MGKCPWVGVIFSPLLGFLIKKITKRGNLEMNHKYFKILIYSLLLSGFLGVMACATGGVGYGPSTPQGDYNTPTDPEYWKMWENSRGLG